MKGKDKKLPFSGGMRHDTSNMAKGKSSQKMGLKGGTAKKSGRGR